MIPILILNWQEPEKTCECIDSLILHINSKSPFVIVDNHSQDDSLEIISLHLQSKGFKKTSAINYYSVTLDINIDLICTKENKGYAGGNNFGIEYIKQNYFNFEAIWLVNNDVFVKNDALSPMIEHLSKPYIGFVGSVILNGNIKAQDIIECYGGGRYFPILGKAKLLGSSRDITTLNNNDFLYFDKKLDYIMGCSLLVTKDVITKVGLMDERYFMYSEEIDWQKRADKLGYKFCVSKKSHIYHYGSVSSGGRTEKYHYLRNRAAIIYNKKFYGSVFAFFSTINLSLIISIQERKSLKNILSGIKGCFSGLIK